MGKIFSGCFRIFIRELEQAIGPDCETLLDIGCGSNSPISYLSKRFYSVGIDAHLQSIEKNKEKGIHNKYYNMDFSELGSFDSCSFDCVTALDVIEHIKKAKRLRLLENMERIAKKRIVLFTPNGFLPQSAHNNNPLQIHKSGWKVKEMRNL